MNGVVAASVLSIGLGAGVDCHANEHGFYFGTEGAYISPTIGKSDGTSFFRPPEIIHVPVETIRFDESGFGWSALVGYRVARHLAVELGYLDFGSIDVEETFDLTDVFPNPGGPPEEFSMDFNLEVAGPMASVMGILPLSEKFEAFGRAGILWAGQEVRLSRRFSFNEAEELWGLGLGVQAQVGRGWFARLEYQRFEDMPGTLVSGEVRLERLTLGATYNLGSGGDPATAGQWRSDDDATGFYVVADVGITESAVGKSGGVLLTLPHIPGAIFQVLPVSATAEGSDLGAGAALGYRINRYLAAEFAYTDLGNVEIREHYVVGPIGDPFFVPQFEFDVDLTSRVAGPSFSLLGILAIGDNFELFGRAGIMFADHEVSASPESIWKNADELAVWGAGADVELGRRWSVRLAYENLEKLQRTILSGSIRHERFVFGVNYDF